MVRENIITILLYSVGIYQNGVSSCQLSAEVSYGGSTSNPGSLSSPPLFLVGPDHVTTQNLGRKNKIFALREGQ